jgi:hypothetical protein
MTLDEALAEIAYADATQVTPGQLAYLLETLEWWLSEKEFSFNGGPTICKLSQSIRHELEATESRYLPIAGDDGDKVDHAWTHRP